MKRRKEGRAIGLPVKSNHKVKKINGKEVDEVLFYKSVKNMVIVSEHGRYLI